MATDYASISSKNELMLSISESGLGRILIIAKNNNDKGTALSDG